MDLPASPRLERLFRAIVRGRAAIVLLYAAIVPAAVALAVRVPSDGAIDRLVVASDPDYVATGEFHAIFPEGKHVVLLVEAPDPLADSALARSSTVEARVRRVPGVEAYAAADLFARAGGGRSFREFASGTELLRKQGLVGDDFLGIAVTFSAETPAERDAALEAIDAAIGEAPDVLRVGGPYVESWIERETGSATAKYFPLFGAFVVLLVLSLYRSWRSLAAFLLTLAAAVAVSVGIAQIAGWSFTIVSALVPLTVLVTATATLVYVHSRFVDCPAGTAPDEHQIRALANKFLPCTASVFAAVVGFAALAVSNIRPIYEMGLWTAAALAATWVVCFTLFPALQRILRTPTRQERETSVRWFPALVDVLVPFSYRYRFLLVPGSLALMALGGWALSGMRLQTDALDYVDRGLPVYRDTRRFEKAISGLTQVEVWVKTAAGGVLDPEVLRGLATFSRELESDPRIGSVAGPTTPLRWMRYAAGGGDRLPDDPDAWEKLAGDLEQLLLSEPAIRGFVDVGTLENARLTVITRASGFEGLDDLRETILSRWRTAVAAEPALSSVEVRVVGDGLLQAKIAHYLVPTLVESFAITAAVIFVAFLLVFRSGAARLMAMIPSIFSILVMFLVMRLTGIPLNVATILIASTVLGASENDQIHFFYHFQERRKSASCEAALRHAMLVAGRAIFFATLINAGGFLALAFSDLPPMRQFGIVAASAFVLAMAADFTALPAALWIVFRERPDSLQKKR